MNYAIPQTVMWQYTYMHLLGSAKNDAKGQKKTVYESAYTKAIEDHNNYC